MWSLILRGLILAGSVWGISAISGDTTNVQGNQTVYTESSMMDKVKMWLTFIIMLASLIALVYAIIYFARKQKK